jgi:hypothetical protein
LLIGFRGVGAQSASGIAWECWLVRHVLVFGRIAAQQTIAPQVVLHPNLPPIGRRESANAQSGFGEAIPQYWNAVVAPERFLLEDEERDPEDVIVRRLVLGALVGEGAFA